MRWCQMTARARTSLLSCLLLCFPLWAVAASPDDITEMKRAIEALRAENRELVKRIATIEAERAEQAQGRDGVSKPPIKPMDNSEQEKLERRIKELEMAIVAQEDAVRSIIKSSVSTLGSKINESVALGGAFEMIVGRSKNFSGVSKSSLGLNTAEFDFEIQVNDWSMANVVLEYVDGTSATFTTTSGYDTAVDRINLDTAFLVLGNTQKFPAYLKTGRMILPFGTSTGVHRADVLSIESPTTIEVFESRKNAIGFGLAFPTPTLTPPKPPVVVPPVKPRVINPLISSLSKAAGPCTVRSSRPAWPCHG